MSRLIDANALDDVIQILNAKNWGITRGDYKMIDAVLFEFPTIEERKKGKWIWEFADNGWANHICSECGWTKNTDIHVTLGYNFCPNCGSYNGGEK